MSVELGKHQFFPWVRRGAAAHIDPATVEKTDGSAGQRVAIPVGITLRKTLGGADVGTAQVSVTAQLYGPGDVVGVDPRHVIRTEPRNLTANYEPNYFAGIEFDHPEFPWLVTPAAPGGDRLRPWISLICLKPSELGALAAAGKPLPTITVTDLRALPDLADSYAWAHTQITGDVTAAGLASLIADQPHRAMSRLLCPRHLEPDTAYHAFLVPAYDTGVLAGLGRDASTATASRPAWDATSQSPLTLPVYFSFDFHTSASGDFESLVRQIKPRELDQLGFRPIDVDHAGWGLPKANRTLDLGGALKSPNAQARPWTGQDADTYRSAVSDLINVATPATADGPADPVIAPPVYGHWHAAHPKVDAGAPAWMRSLNQDPRNRIPAGLGTRVVLDQRSQLLASAWQQVAGIIAANDLLRRAQAARAALAQVYAVRLQPLTGEATLMITAALHTSLKASPKTVHATLSASRIPVRAASAAFRRVVRPLGPISRRQGATSRSPASLLGRLNRSEISVVPPLHAPNGMVSIDQVSDGLLPPVLPSWLWLLLARFWWLLLIAGVILLALGLLLAASGLLPPAVVLLGLGLLLIATALAVRGRSASWTVAVDVRTSGLTAQTLEAVPPRANFRIMPAGQPQPASDATIAGSTDSADATGFRQEATTLAGMVQAPLLRPLPPPPVELDLGALSATILTRLDPTVTVATRIESLIQVGPAVTWPRPGRDRLDQIMAAPDFPQPMYEPLRDLAKAYILPGLDTVPPDTMTVLEANHAFIEAYLVGLNHEMARQLLWHDYPTDMRGSYFRQFWDVRSYVPRPSDPADLKEALKDIRPIHTWPDGNDLGSNQNRADLGDNVVLLMRGELIRRYPTAVIYACQAVLGADGKRQLGTTELHPLYRGAFDPDVTYFGFPLTPDQARGSHQPGQPQGYFFVFQQQPTEPRFGLEPAAVGPVTDWNDLSWEDFDLPADPTVPFFAPVRKQPHNVQAPLDLNDWGKDAARMAVITLRRPVRVAIHAEMMLP